MPTMTLYSGILSTALQLCLSVLLIRRGLHRQLRFFFAYNIFSIFSQLGSILLYSGDYARYFKFFWASEAVYTILSFLCLYELFHWVFRNFYGILWFRLAFPCVGAMMLAVALVRSLLLPAPDAPHVIAVIIALEIAVGFLQVGLFALFILLVRFFHMRWRQYAFGVALGFGIIACGDLAGYLLRSEFGTKLNHFMQIAPPVAYIIAVVVWLAALVPPQPDHPLKNWVPPLSPEEMLAELRAYTRTVKGVLRR